MPLYDVYVTCDQCGQPHSVHVQLTVEDDNMHRVPLKNVFNGHELPPAVVFMQTNSYRCPHTKQLFQAGNLDDAILVAA